MESQEIEARRGFRALGLCELCVNVREWGAVREEYGEDCDAWNYFTHDKNELLVPHLLRRGFSGLAPRTQRLICTSAPPQGGCGDGFLHLALIA
jgi:hypothetical protein